jgi:stage II sporulation protein AA (anti-sigma F factor antagonist)
MSAASRLDIAIERFPDQFSLYGEIDAHTAPYLAELADVHRPLHLDLSGVTFMDSSGLAGLVRLYQRCQHAGCSFRIVDCSPQVERLLMSAFPRSLIAEEERRPASRAT